MFLALAPGVLVYYKESWTQRVSLICFLIHLVVFLTFKRVVSDVGKSHISIENVKLLAFNTNSNRELFVGQIPKSGKSAGLSSTPCSFFCVFNKHHWIVCCLQSCVIEMRSTKKRPEPCLMELKACFMSLVFHKNQDSLPLSSKYNFQKV